MTVTPEVVAVSLGRTAPAPGSTEFNQWQMWISDALLLIQSRLGSLVLLDQAKLDYVVREAVAAHIKHPDDAMQMDVAVDDARVSRMYRTGKGRVQILDEWWDLLSPAQSKGAFTLDSVGPGTIHLPWCSLMFAAAYCSCGVDIAGTPIYEVG